MPLIKSFFDSLTDAIVAQSTLHTTVILMGTIGTAVYLVYEKILRPPPSLRHIPHLNFFILFKALVMRNSIDQLTKEVNRSSAVQSSHNGLYLRRDNLGWTVRITQPDDIRNYMANRELFPKSVVAVHNRRGTLAGRALFTSNNILYSNGHGWRKHRKIINPAFHHAMPMKVFERVSQKAVDIIETDKPIDAHDISHRWSLQVMGETIMGHDLGTLEDKESEWVVRFELIVSAALNTFYFAFPYLERNLFKFVVPELRTAHREMTVYGNMINEIVRKKRETILMCNTSDIDNRDKDLLTLMIEASLQEKEQFTDEEFQADVFALFLAGDDTTSSTISFILYYLAAHQHIQQRAREEAINVFGDGYDIRPTFEETQELPYITMIIKESLRMSPPITTFTDRVATEDTVISGTFIPKGTHVGLTVYELHHNPKVWKDPDTFDPERFAPGAEADQISGTAWVPFGGGFRACAGMKSSMTQQRVFLSMLLRKYEWHLPENSIHKNGVVTEGYGIMRPLNLQLVFRKRY